MFAAERDGDGAAEAAQVLGAERAPRHGLAVSAFAIAGQGIESVLQEVGWRGRQARVAQAVEPS